MAKNSTLTPFFAHGILKMKERGIYNAYSKRHFISEPNCKPLREEGKPLGMEKFAPLFVFYLGGCAMSLIIFVLENIFKPSSGSSMWQNQENRNKLEVLKERIEKLKIEYQENIVEVGKMNQKAIEIKLMLTLPTFKTPVLKF